MGGVLEEGIVDCCFLGAVVRNGQVKEVVLKTRRPTARRDVPGALVVADAMQPASQSNHCIGRYVQIIGLAG